ncbi:MAG: hypothetical protein ACRDQD_08255 [Nocardioidaceae bacterium]
MTKPRPIPGQLRSRPFSYAEALAAGVSLRMFQGSRFRLLHREVYICADVELTVAVRARAALLILPRDTVVTGVTALRVRSLDVGRDGAACTSRRSIRTSGMWTGWWCIGAGGPRCGRPKRRSP